MTAQVKILRSKIPGYRALEKKYLPGTRILEKYSD